MAAAAILLKSINSTSLTTAHVQYDDGEGSCLVCDSTLKLITYINLTTDAGYPEEVIAPLAITELFEISNNHFGHKVHNHKTSLHTRDPVKITKI